MAIGQRIDEIPGSFQPGILRLRGLSGTSTPGRTAPFGTKSGEPQKQPLADHMTKPVDRQSVVNKKLINYFIEIMNKARSTELVDVPIE